MTRSRYRFRDQHYPHFMTSTVVAWLPVFSYPEFASVVIDSWRFLQSQRHIDVLAWVLMENHLHWIGVGPNLTRCVGEFKSFTATSILKVMEQKGTKTLLQELQYYKLKHKSDQDHQLLQEGSRPVMIETEAVMLQKIEYIHYNPVRRGFVDDPIHWRYSSARCYAGEGGLLKTVVDWR